MRTSPSSRSALRVWPPLVLTALLAALGVVVIGTLLLRQASPVLPIPSEASAPQKAQLPVPGDGVFEVETMRVSLEGLPDGPDDEAHLPALDGDEPPTVDGALIVRTASLELEAGDVTAVLGVARREIAALGGYVAGSDEVDQGDRRWAGVVYRVPVERFGEAIDALRGLADRVVRESTQSQEVTATVVDLDARITNLRASEAALAQIMERAGRIEDVLAVQMRLEDVRGRIEQLEAQRDGLAEQAALSTISVAWSVPVAAVTAVQESWSLADEVDAALAQTVEALQAIAGLAVWIGLVVLPLVGLPTALIAAFAVLLRRRLRGVDPSGPGGPAAAAAAGE